MKALLRAWVCSLWFVFSGVFAGGSVDINAADAAALAAGLQGVGLSKAQAIVEYRKKHGPFQSIDDLARVNGVGAKTLELNRERLTVGTVRKKP